MVIFHSYVKLPEGTSNITKDIGIELVAESKTPSGAGNSYGNHDVISNSSDRLGQGSQWAVAAGCWGPSSGSGGPMGTQGSGGLVPKGSMEILMIYKWHKWGIGMYFSKSLFWDMGQNTKIHVYLYIIYIYIYAPKCSNSICRWRMFWCSIPFFETHMEPTTNCKCPCMKHCNNNRLTAVPFRLHGSFEDYVTVGIMISSRKTQPWSEDLWDSWGFQRVGTK